MGALEFPAWKSVRGLDRDEEGAAWFGEKENPQDLAWGFFDLRGRKGHHFPFRVALYSARYFLYSA